MSLNAVIYTDGSARPNPGNIGWGVHGYIYQNITDKPIVVQKHTVTNKGYLYPEKFRDDVTPVEPIEYIDAYDDNVKLKNVYALILPLFYPLPIV